MWITYEYHSRGIIDKNTLMNKKVDIIERNEGAFRFLNVRHWVATLYLLKHQCVELTILVLLSFSNTTYRVVITGVNSTAIHILKR